MNAERRTSLFLVLAGLTVYFVLFYATRLPSLETAPDHIFRRAHFFTFLLLPDELLTAQWFGLPPDFSPEFSLLDRLPVLAVAGVILGCSFSLGWLLLAVFRLDRHLTRLENVVFSTVVGLNVVSTYVLLVGLFGWLDSVWVFAVPAALTLAAAGYLRWRRAGRPADEKGQQPPQDDGRQRDAIPRDDWLSPRWLWLAAPFVVVILLGGMLPPSEFDMREYHLEAPKEFFQEGRIGFLPHNFYANMALGTEMLSLLGMVIAGDWWLGALAGKTVIAAFGPLGALGLLCAGRRLFSPAAGIVAAVVYISTPWIVQVSTIGFVEGASACYLLLALYAVLLWQKSKRGSANLLMLAGYLAGGAASCKYPGVLFVVLPLTVWIVLVRLPGRWQTAWKPLGVFLLAVIVGCGLWFGKNWVLTGNPTYPLMYELFGGKTWTAEKSQMWNQVHLPQDFSMGALRADLARVGLRSEWFSPLLVPLAVLALMTRQNRRLSIGLFVYFGFVIAAWWLFALRIDRYWVPAMTLLALLAGVGACWNADVAWRRVLPGLLVFGAVSNFLVATGGPISGGYNRYFVSLERLRSASERVDAWHRYFNRYAADGRVLLVGEAQVFDLEVPILYNTWLDDSIFESLVKAPATGALRRAEEIRAALGARKITHVYVHWGEIARYRATGYGSTEFIQPAVFDKLVADGILEPIQPTAELPELEEHPGRGYRVLTGDED